jgi:hypothetical protein
MKSRRRIAIRRYSCSGFRQKAAELPCRIWFRHRPRASVGQFVYETYEVFCFLHGGRDGIVGRPAARPGDEGESCAG